MLSQNSLVVIRKVCRLTGAATAAAVGSALPEEPGMYCHPSNAYASASRYTVASKCPCSAEAGARGLISAAKHR